MKKINVIFPEDRLERVKNILYTLSIGGMVVSQVRGFGLQRGKLKDKEKRFFEFPKIKLEIVVRDSELQKALDLILETTQTGRIGDGKIFVSDVQEVIRIRTGEYGENAV